MNRKTKSISIVIYVLQHLIGPNFPLLKRVTLTYWKPIMGKNCLYLIANIKHYSLMMNISQGFIPDIVIYDCLLDKLMDIM